MRVELSARAQDDLRVLQSRDFQIVRAALDQLGRDSPDQRRFPEAAGSEDDDVLTVEDIATERGDFFGTVREGLIESEGAVAKRVVVHPAQLYHHVLYVSV